MARDNEIAGLISKGLKVRDIQELTGASSYKIARIRRERGFPTRESRRQAVRELMEFGLRPYMAAEVLGLHKSVGYRLRRLEASNG